MSDPRQSYSLEEIKGMLLDRRHQVAQTYAPPAPGSFTDKGAYFTLNPGRADRSVGSFVVWLEGPKMGRWRDFATGQHGDLIDLIALNLGCDLKAAWREARGFLGLMSDAPEDVARRKAAAERAKRLAEEARRRDADDRERKRKGAVALWLEARERIAGTPVEFYLRDERGIDLAQLGRQPRAIRFHPNCYCRQVIAKETHDPETGEVIPARIFEGSFPAMLAIINDAQGRPVACHRTWLQFRGGRWQKAGVPKPKKVLGDYAGGAIHLWSGIGPKGGKGKRLAEAEPGSHVFLSEGIEDALSCVMVLPDARVLAAISLSNFAAIALPPAIAEVTLIADQDEGDQAQDQLARAIEAHAKAGRRVRVWKNQDGGKDLNDALRARRSQQQEAGAA